MGFRTIQRLQEKPKLSCCLCGQAGHSGLLNDCPKLLPEHLQAERASERSREETKQRQQRLETDEQQRHGGWADRRGTPRWNQHDDRVTRDVRRNEVRPARQAPLRVSYEGLEVPGSGGVRGGGRPEGRAGAWQGQGYGPERYGQVAVRHNYMGSNLAPHPVGNLQPTQGQVRSGPGQFPAQPQYGRNFYPQHQGNRAQQYPQGQYQPPAPFGAQHLQQPVQRQQRWYPPPDVQRNTGYSYRR
jgi:hypothetical protein